MGSLGWCRCYWCWKWEHNMHIPDPLCDPLCHKFIDRLCDGLRPPWQPDARARRQHLLQFMGFEENVAILVAEFSEDYLGAIGASLRQTQTRVRAEKKKRKQQETTNK